MLSNRFGALEAVAYSSIKLSRYVSECEMSMDLLVAGLCWRSERNRGARKSRECRAADLLG